ncbi:CHASE domain-containing protein [Caldimonas brevitalea]|nr:CHASE domain-containing protein [Caldimonas brevitalea]
MNSRRVESTPLWSLRPRGGWRHALPGLVLVLGCGLTAWAAQFAGRLEEREARRELQEHARIVGSTVERRIGGWAEVLHGVRGLFAASQVVTRREFSEYFEQLELRRRYPGFLSLQFVRYVRHQDKAAFEASLRAEIREPGRYGANFAIHPEGERADYYVTHFIEPIAGNERALGFDAALTPQRREALERARDRGELTGSGRLQLVQSGNKVGYVLRQPVYRAGMPRRTLEQRRAAFLGLSTVVLSVEDFIISMMGRELLERVDFRLHDVGWAGEAVAPPSPHNLLYDSAAQGPHEVASAGALSHAATVAVGGRVWRFEFRPRSHGPGTASDTSTTLVLACGLLVSLLVWQLLRLQLAGRERLEARVAQRTQELALANEALRDSEQRLELALAGADLGVWDWHIETGVLRWNERWLALRGYTEPPDSPDLEWWRELIHPDDRPAVSAALQDHLEGRLPSYSAEYRVRTQQGGWLWLLDRGRVVARDVDGRPLRISGTNLDISERKRAEDARVAADTAQRLAAAKDEFMARMSHELRTPLNAILGFTQLLQREAEAPLAERQRERVRQIRRAGEYLLAMVTDLLDLSAIEGGHVPIVRQAVSIARATAEAVDMVRQQAEAEDVTLENKAQHSEGMVEADPLRLRQVLVNLLTNAIKYNQPRGHVTLDAVARAGEWGLSVVDTGIGLAAEQIDKLFQPFERLGAHRLGIPGTGLGLALSQRLTTMMGGRITVTSDVGVGSCFTLWLPNAGATATRPAASPPRGPDVVQPAEPAPLTVLYAEDDEVNVLVVEGMLALRPGVRLLVARSGMEALETARRERPDLMLIDMQLGDMHGIELRARLAALPECAEVPCIGLSSDALPSQVRAARDAGFAEYLTKPVQLQDLLRVIDRRALAVARGISSVTRP